MHLPHPRPLRRALSALLLLAAAGCTAGTEPELGGEYVGSLDSPFPVEGAALIELTHPDIRALSAPGRVLVVQGVTERTLRVMILNPPRDQHGGPITFVVRMAKGARPPHAEVLNVSGPLNQARDFTGEYAVRFTRREPDPYTPPAPPAQSGPAPRVRFGRLVAPFFPGGAPLEPEEAQHVDFRGNRNTVFDFGDVRGYLFWYPWEVPAASTWTR